MQFFVSTTLTEISQNAFMYIKSANIFLQVHPATDLASNMFAVRFQLGSRLSALRKC